jgi:AhpD family alkylhydroperoxidase
MQDNSANRQSTFTKRTFTMRSLLTSLSSVVLYGPVLIIAMLKPSTSRALREKVMLGVNSVNECRYCSWLHTGLALKHGVNLDELEHLLDAGTFGTISERDATAILFAQNFADTQSNPTPEAKQALAKHFTAYQRLELSAYVHFMHFANLCGNSADAWLARVRGWKVPNGHPVPEAIAGILSAPILFIGWLRSRNSRPDAMKKL